MVKPFQLNDQITAIRVSISDDSSASNISAEYRRWASTSNISFKRLSSRRALKPPNWICFSFISRTPYQYWNGHLKDFWHVANIGGEVVVTVTAIIRTPNFIMRPMPSHNLSAHRSICFICSRWLIQTGGFRQVIAFRSSQFEFLKSRFLHRSVCSTLVNRLPDLLR